MPRRCKRSSPKPPSQLPKDLKADLRLNGKPPSDTQMSNPTPKDLESGIIKNWNLPKPNINTCIDPEHWPRNEPDPRKWPIDIVRLLHEASTIDLKSKGAILCSNNDVFRRDLAWEISSRQSKNKSRQGTVSWMTANDLKATIKKLHYMTEDDERKKTQNPEPEEKRADTGDKRPSVRRGRSKANNGMATKDGLDETNGTAAVQQGKAKRATRGRERPRRNEINEQDKAKPGIKRQASDLPIRPARKLRGVRSPKSELAAPPPVTPANAPENSNDEEEEEEDQENEPPEPVSGRHIYGDFIKPTTVDFNAGAEHEAPAQAKTRQTRKRGRADNEKPPTEEQVDSDPRDIDATGFLSELDPKEARRRRKPRLSRLPQGPVLEPAWSQDVHALPQTPLLTPATNGPISGTPAAPVQGGVASPAVKGTDGDDTTSLGIETLMDLLPGIPDNASSEERSMLEDRIALVHRDIVAYQTAVWEISQRTG